MEDTSQRKSPPDKSTEVIGDNRNKKKKVEEKDHCPKSNENKEGQDVLHEPTNVAGDTGKRKVISYKQSLMGFNGVANDGFSMEMDDLFWEDKDLFWKMPEPSEEVKQLMEVYPVVPISEEEYNGWCKPWNFSLVITVLGKKFNLYMLKAHLAKIWGIAEFELIDLPNNYFIVRFTSGDQWREHYRKVLYDGPWVIAHHCILVQRWSPEFDPFKNQLGRIVTWVRIPHIPVICYNKHFMQRLGERIGQPLKVDLNTLADNMAIDAKVERA